MSPTFYIAIPRIGLACFGVLVLACDAMTGAAHAQAFTTLWRFGAVTNATGYWPRGQLVQGPDGMLYGTAVSGPSYHGTLFKVQPDGSGFTVLMTFDHVSVGLHPEAGLTLSGSVLYGTTEGSGENAEGNVFKMNTDGTGFKVVKYFPRYGSDGRHTRAGLTVSGSVLYGTTYDGGSSNLGTVFKVNTDGTGFATLKHFTGSDGNYPYAGLTLSGSVLYGTTYSGGNSNLGTVFKVNVDGTGYTVLKHFTGSEGSNPYADLTLSGSVLHGTTSNGGSSNYGTVFKINTDGTGYTVLKHFTGSDGQGPRAGLTLSADVLYGTTLGGGSSYYGTVFKVNTDGTGFAVLRHFTGYPNLDGQYPYAGLTLSGSVLYGTTSQGGSSDRGTFFKVNTDGTDYAVLTHFFGEDGTHPYAGPVMSGSVLYGTTYDGGNMFYGTHGTVFKINSDGTGYALLKHFTGYDGEYPYGRLILSDNVLYGTTYSGGGGDFGTVFKMNTDGTAFTVLKHFGGLDGRFPYAGLTLSGGVLFGTTYGGGVQNRGTVFRINTDGTGYTVLKYFAGYPSDGAEPRAALLSSDNVLYGTTRSGGSSNLGTVFRVNADGTDYTVLKHFTGSDGKYPYARLTTSSNVLYGTTHEGGSLNYGTVFKMNTDGTGYTVLKHFTYTDGASPRAGLTLSDNVLYGTTYSGGYDSYSSDGKLFKMNTDGTGYMVLKYFIETDGDNPSADLALSDNVLYGTTYSGGSGYQGTIFKLDLSVPLNIQSRSDTVVLSWPGPAFALQVAPAVNGVYTNIPGATSPYTNSVLGPQQFFRLRLN